MAIDNIQSGVNLALLNSSLPLNGPSANIADNSELLNTTLNAGNESKLIDTDQLLANTASQQIGLTNQLLSGLGSGDSVTSELVGLQIYGRNQQGLSTLSDDLKNVTGKIIDQLV